MLEQRASNLETQLSDALVDVQRRDATIFELKAALQVCLMISHLHDFAHANTHLMRTRARLVFLVLLTIYLSGERRRIEHQRGLPR